MINKNCPSIEDLILDSSFIEFAFGTDSENNLTWQAFILAHPECAENVKHAKRIILSIKIKDYKDIEEGDIEKIITSVESAFKAGEEKYRPDADKNRLVSMLRYAAVIFMLLGTCIGTYYIQYVQTKHEALIKTERYKTFSNSLTTSVLLKLSDQSTVILRPKATIRYPEKFQDSRRQVYLSGDAFFEVHKDKLRPFYVISKFIKIKVLGTSFMVTENAANGNTKVLVSTGRVQVTSTKPYEHNLGKQKMFILIENEQATFNAGANKINKSKVIVPLPLSLQSTSKNLSFVSAQFSSVVKELESAYNIRIDYNAQVMASCLLTASLVDQSLDERLELICKAVEASYHYKDGKVIITGKGCK